MSFLVQFSRRALLKSVAASLGFYIGSPIFATTANDVNSSKRLGLKIGFVGLPDKLDIRPANRLWIPVKIQAIPPDTKVLGVYATPDFNTLMPLFLVLF